MATHVEGTGGRIGREWTLDMPSSLFFFEHAMQMPESWYGSGRMSLSYLTKIEDSACLHTTARCPVSLEHTVTSGFLARFAHNVVRPGPFGLGQCRLASRKKLGINSRVLGEILRPCATFFWCFQQFTRTALCLPTSGLPMDTSPDLHVVGMSTTGRIQLVSWTRWTLFASGD